MRKKRKRATIGELFENAFYSRQEYNEAFQRLAEHPRFPRNHSMSYDDLSEQVSITHDNFDLYMRDFIKRLNALERKARDA